jgi:hypothetical protein
VYWCENILWLKLRLWGPKIAVFRSQPEKLIAREINFLLGRGI